MTQAKRNGNIEILRFVFSILIVLHHFEQGVFQGRLFTACYLGVEFFFIITGVFLGKKLKAEKEKNRAEPFGAAAKAGAQTVWKRICGIYPYFFLATLIGFAARLAIGISKPRPEDVGGLFGDFAFVQLFGLKSITTTGTVWYLCALFFALLLIYPFVRKFYDAYVYSFAMLFPPVLIGLITKKAGSLSMITENLFGVFNVGILRAVAMISVGLVVNELADRLKALPVNRVNRFVFTAMEPLLYLCLFVLLIFFPRSKFDYLLLILLTMVLIVTLSEKSCLYGRFDNRFSLFLGKASMILFMCHFFWVNYISRYTKHLPTALREGTLTDVVLGFLLTFTTGVAVYFGGVFLQFVFRKIKTALFALPK